MKVRELMLRDLTSVDPGDPVHVLVETLDKAETSSIPVTDENDRLVGIISEHDVLAAALPRYMELLHSASFLPNLDQLAFGLARIADEPVSRFMAKQPCCVPADAGDLQAADLMLRNKLRLLPVVDAEGRLVGVVRRVDLFIHVLRQRDSRKE